MLILYVTSYLSVPSISKVFNLPQSRNTKEVVTTDVTDKNLHLINFLSLSVVLFEFRIISKKVRERCCSLRFTQMVRNLRKLQQMDKN